MVGDVEVPGSAHRVAHAVEGLRVVRHHCCTRSQSGAQHTGPPHLSNSQCLMRGHHLLQLDSFNKANTRGTRRLSKLFSGRKSPKTPSPGGGSTPGGSAPGNLTLEEMLLYQTVSLCKRSVKLRVQGLGFVQCECIVADSWRHPAEAAHDQLSSGAWSWLVGSTSSLFD